MMFRPFWIILALLGVISQANAEELRLIIKFKPSVKTSAALKKELKEATGFEINSLIPMAGGAFIISVPKANSAVSTESILEKLRKDPNILYALKDRIGHFKPLPESPDSGLDPYLSHDLQWDEFAIPGGIMLESRPGLRDGAWSYTTGKAEKPVVVAVLDTGVELNSSLIENLIKDQNGNILGWNFAGQNNNLSDETLSYHGTHVAGTIAGYGDTITGMGEDLKILPIKIPDSSGMFYESAVINAIYWAVGAEVPGAPVNPYPAKVLNMSFGVDERPGKEIDHCDKALQEALYYARKKGAVIVAAAGNDNQWEHYNAPAACNSTMKIAATGPAGLRAFYSNYGPGITLAAPGGDKRFGVAGGILSTVNPDGGFNNSGFNFYQGTSMAAPHVAGVAGLVIAASKRALSPKKIEQIIFKTTHNFGKTEDANASCVGEKPCGHGILDAEKAVKAAVRGYDVLFSAPLLQKAELKACANGLLQADAETLQNKEAIWLKDKTNCQPALNFSAPKIYQNKKGDIYAVYGRSTYKLEQSRFKQCEVIGYDGVGCFR